MGRPRKNPPREIKSPQEYRVVRRGEFANDKLYTERGAKIAVARGVGDAYVKIQK